jgi:methylated-DNA-[protein]-cysteine S-methyltransferase
MRYIWIYENTKIGKIALAEEDNKITNLYFLTDNIEGDYKETDLIKKAKKQLDEYFEGKRRKFDLPIKLKGTEFQKAVWSALETIEYGHTISYKELATRVGNEKASRAVGTANAKNPVPIFIPCHRVVRANGNIGGYLGGYIGGIDIKECLLNIEKNKLRL